MRSIKSSTTTKGPWSYKIMQVWDLWSERGGVEVTWKHSGGGISDIRLATAEGRGKWPPGTAFMPTPEERKRNMYCHLSYSYHN